MTTLMYLIYTLAEPHTYRKWEPIDNGIWFRRQCTPELSTARTDTGSRGKNSVGWGRDCQTSTLRFVLVQNFFTILRATNRVARVKIQIELFFVWGKIFGNKFLKLCFFAWSRFWSHSNQEQLVPPCPPPPQAGSNFDRWIYEWKLKATARVRAGLPLLREGAATSRLATSIYKKNCLPTDLPRTEAYFSFQLRLKIIVF